MSVIQQRTTVDVMPSIRTLGQKCIDATTPQGAIKHLTDFEFYLMKLKEEWCLMNNELGFTIPELEALVKLCATFVFPQVMDRLLYCFPFEYEPKTLVTSIATSDDMCIVLDRFSDHATAASQCICLSKLLEFRGPLYEGKAMPMCEKLYKAAAKTA